MRKNERRKKIEERKTGFTKNEKRKSPKGKNKISGEVRTKFPGKSKRDSESKQNRLAGEEGNEIHEEPQQK